MNRLGKLIICLVAAFAMLSLSAFFVFATGSEDADTVENDFTVYAADGTEKSELSGVGEDKLREAIALLESGDTVKLNRDLELKRSIAFVEGNAQNPVTYNFDLGGNMLYAMSKFTIFFVNHYTTLNTYSSEPGGVVYCTNKADPSYGGNVFFIKGNHAVINAGDIKVGDKLYPGSNLTTFSTCLIDTPTDTEATACDAASSFNVKGGMNVSICSDYTGFIIPRGGRVTYNFENSDLIFYQTAYPINAPGIFTKLNFTNCRLLHATGTSGALFNNLNAEVSFKDCVMNYAPNVGASDADPEPLLSFEGNNIFEMKSIDTSFIKGGENLVLAKVHADYKLTTGETKYWIYDKSGTLIKIDMEIPKFNGAAILCSPDETQTYKFVTESGKSTTEVWKKDIKPTFPYELSDKVVEGTYKYAWKMSVDKTTGVITYTAGKVADFPLYITAVYDDILYINFYIPAEIIDDGYLDFSGAQVGGISLASNDWKKITKNGKDYYRAHSDYLDESTADDWINISLPCDFGIGLRIETTWAVNLKDYVEHVLATEADAVYTEAEYALVKSIKNDFFTADGQ